MVSQKEQKESLQAEIGLLSHRNHGNHRYIYTSCRDVIALLGADVEESGDGAAYAVGLIVNEGIEETGVAVQGDDIVVGDGCGDQGAMTLPENNFMVHGEGFMVHGERCMVQGKGFMVKG